jgi:hypothetical protein
MSTENKVISIAVGDRLQIEGVGTVELVVVAPEQNEQPKQHPLVGKWVRFVGNTSNLYKQGKWYEVCEDNCDKEYPFGIKYENTQSNYCTHNSNGDFLSHFDLSNPCDYDCNMPEAINPKYKVGDEVLVVNEGLTYTTFKEAFWFFGLKEKQINDSFENNSKATVFAICKHGRRSDNLYALRDSEGNECVIGEEGIKLAGIDKQEWLDAASKLFDSWMKISGGYVPKENDTCYSVSFTKENEMFTFSIWSNNIDSPFNFETLEQKDQFLSENEKDLKTFFHQV